jgi:hypothetical protein
LDGRTSGSARESSKLARERDKTMPCARPTEQLLIAFLLPLPLAVTDESMKARRHPRGAPPNAAAATGTGWPLCAVCRWVGAGAGVALRCMRHAVPGQEAGLGDGYHCAYEFIATANTDTRLNTTVRI